MSPSVLRTGEYLEGVVGLLLIALAMAAASFWLRQRVLAEWSGAPARLAEAVIGLFLLTSIALALGTFGLLATVPLVAAVLVLATGVEFWTRKRPAPSTPNASAASPVRPEPEPVPAPKGALAAAVGVVTVTFALWGMAGSWSIDEGITNFDSVWYHLPFAAEMAQSGSTLGLHRSETVFLNWLYPQGSELIHAIGMVMTGRDATSVAINFGWLGLAFLAGWCIGRPYGRGHVTVAAVAVYLASHNLVAREPGTAKNDVAAIALLLAAVALALQARTSRPVAPAETGAANADAARRWPVILAAVAAGLAVGVKVTVVAPVVGLLVGSIALSPAGRRAAHAGKWMLGIAVGGGYWYIRNSIVAGNPLPQVREIGPVTLPGPEILQAGRPDFTVGHYLFDREVLRDFFLPGLERGFGDLWPAGLALALAGAIWAVFTALAAGRRVPGETAAGPGRCRPSRFGAGPAGTVAPRHDRALAAAGLAALVGLAAYLVTPLGAAGPEGEPVAFAINLRFAIPALCLGITLAAVATRTWRPEAGWAAFAALVLLGLLTNGFDRVVFESGGRLFGWSLALAAVAIPAAVVYIWRRVGAGRLRIAVAALLAAALAFTLVAGLSLQRTYFESRYRDYEAEAAIAGMTEPYRWANEQSGVSIALAGTTAGFQAYGFYGPLLDNEVFYLGRESPAGGFHPIPSCREFREAVNEAAPDFLVTSPFLDFADPETPVRSPEQRWIEGDPAVMPVVEGEGSSQPVAVWVIGGKLDTGGCGADEEPHTEVPDSKLGRPG